MNRLQHENSPYLQQHADNPVDWFPWGAEALALAKAQDKPILLSIGYASCHWCHVMAHESFEQPATAALMNELFVNVKVDREERPDLDGIYMQAVQAMTGHGGWPMTVFLTPDGVPFYGGTYFPPTDRHGLPSFAKILTGVAAAYRDQRDRVQSTGQALLEMYQPAQERLPLGALTAQELQRATRQLIASYDERHAGFGGAPKFPPSMSLRFLLGQWARTRDAKALEIAQNTFVAMRHGGIYDQIGGGLHRYSVDERWLVPHFEKMLYDNALFVRLATGLWQASKLELAKDTVEQTLAWLEREMTSPAGGFYSSLDADSEGHEGTFYVWTPDEVRQVAGDDFPVAASSWGLTVSGNFEGRNILSAVAPAEAVARRLGHSAADVTAALQRVATALLKRRDQRVRPGRDEKILTAWNALMLRAVAEAARVFASDNYRRLAERNAEFLWREMVVDDRAMRSHRDGHTKGPGFLEDQAALGLALLEVYSLTGDELWLQRAVRLTQRACQLFWSEADGLFYDTAVDHEALITRPRDVVDNATPSAQSLTAELLMRIAEVTGNAELAELGAEILQQLSGAAVSHPLAFGNLLCAADAQVYGAVQVVLAGGRDDAELRDMQDAVTQQFIPSLVLGLVLDDSAATTALTREKGAIGGRATGYVCRRYLCDAPTHHAEELTTQLQRAILPGT
ncbi:MAG: thioredoxin domain-containing protein [Gemmatimonadaceae bacterium]